jgi:hypothetical protein
MTLQLLREGLARRLDRRLLLFASLAAFLLLLTPSSNDFDGPLRMAGQMWHGHVDVPKFSWMEMYVRGERNYLPYPPMVSTLLMPYVLLGGNRLGQPFFNTILIFGAAILVYAFFRAVATLRPWAGWAAAAYALGTPLLHSANNGDVWSLMHSEGSFFFLLALYLLVARRSDVWAGAALMTAAACRHAIVFSGPGVLLLLWRRGDGWLSRRDALTRAARVALGAVPVLALVLALNAAMTGSPFRSPYVSTFEAWNNPPTFGTQYVSGNLRFYFLALPSFEQRFPFLRFNFAGQSIWFMSPFLLGLFFTRARQPFTQALLAAAVPMFVFYLFYYWNGFSQYGARYMQDLYPVLLPAAFLAFTPREGARRAVGLALVVLAVAINLCGAWVVKHYPPTW